MSLADADVSLTESEPASEPSVTVPTTRERFGFLEGVQSRREREHDHDEEEEWEGASDAEDAEKTIVLPKPALLSPPTTPPPAPEPPDEEEVGIGMTTPTPVVEQSPTRRSSSSTPRRIKITPLVERIVVRLFASSFTHSLNSCSRLGYGRRLAT
jgi:hypothetical protein